MSDHTSAGIAADVFTALGKGFAKQTPAVKADRKKLARMMLGYFANYDFCIEDVGIDDELVTLGLAKKCKRCGYVYLPDRAADHGKDRCEEESP